MTLRGVVAAFDAIAMVAAAFAITRGSFDEPTANVVIWGSAAAAVTAALVVLLRGRAEVGWAAIGYIVFAAVLATQPLPLLLLLAVAYMPILDRPRGSLAMGLAITALTAVILLVTLRAI